MGSSKRGKKPSKPAQSRASAASKVIPIAEAAAGSATPPSSNALHEAVRAGQTKAAQAEVKPVATKTSGVETVDSQHATTKVTAAIADLGAAARPETKAQTAPSAERSQSVKLIAPKRVEGVKVSEKFSGEKVFESFTKLGESFFSVDGVKKAAAWYIETSEKLAHQAIELGEKGTSWAKETPLAPIFEAQTSMAKKFIERSASAARNLWQISSHHAA